MFEYIESACDDTLWKALSEIDDELKEFFISSYRIKKLYEKQDKIKAELVKRGYEDIHCMRSEHATIDAMLSSYLKSNFANRNTLVIWPLSWCDSAAEVETIKQDLFEFGYLPPKSYCRNGFWIIEMPTHTAFEIINRHSKGTLAMRCYCGDECLHENM